jgi:putative acetyltransferase
MRCHAQRGVIGLDEMVEIRRMQGGEANALGDEVWDAIHMGCRAYTAAQRQAWLPAPPHGVKWAGKLAVQRVWVAVEMNAPVGFLTLADAGYIDLGFVRAAHQGRGVFTALLRALEGTARGARMRRLWTHASLPAQPAFAARGCHVIAHETVQRAGETLARAEMEKVLT